MRKELFFHKKYCNKYNNQAGLTLIEMLVVIAIIALVSSVMMFNYSDFSTNVSVRNLSQEIALAVRKAQTYATSVRTLTGGSGMLSDTFQGYGASFSAEGSDPNNNVTPWSRQFVLFADTDTPLAEGAPRPSPLSQYNNFSQTTCGSNVSLATGECLESFAISTADKIESICINSDLGTQGGTKDCSSSYRVDITFRRPSPDAIICRISPSIKCDISYVTINLLSAKGLRRSVQVWNTGQIAVK